MESKMRSDLSSARFSFHAWSTKEQILHKIKPPVASRQPWLGSLDFSNLAKKKKNKGVGEEHLLFTKRLKCKINVPGLVLETRTSQQLGHTVCVWKVRMAHFSVPSHPPTLPQLPAFNSGQLLNKPLCAKPACPACSGHKLDSRGFPHLCPIAFLENGFSGFSFTQLYPELVFLEGSSFLCRFFLGGLNSFPNPNSFKFYFQPLHTITLFVLLEPSCWHDALPLL